MFLNAHISVEINGKPVYSVSEVSIKNDSQHIGASCDIVVPLSSRLNLASDSGLEQPVINPYVVQQPVKIVAWYDGYDKQTVFEGFIWDFTEDTPLTIKCLDYVYWLNLESVSYSYTSVTLKKLISDVLADVNKKVTSAGTTPITLIIPIPDIQLKDIAFKLMTPAAILDYFRTSLGLNISLLGSQLYVNLASNTAGTAKLKTDVNVKTSGLQRPDATFKRIKLKAWFYRDNGTKDSIEVGDKEGQLVEVWFNKVKRDTVVYEKLANEALLKARLRHYAGNVTCYLYPKIDNFARVDYTDIRYPQRNGIYTVMESNLRFSENGFERSIRLAYLGEI